MTRAETPATTTSGLSATRASMLVSSRPPSRGSFCTLAGKLEKRSTPTTLAQSPSSQMVSVSEGSRLTMRRGTSGKVTV